MASQADTFMPVSYSRRHPTNFQNSTESINLYKRALKVINPCQNSSLEERKRLVKAVHDGYHSNKNFDHTINDIMRAMDH